MKLQLVSILLLLITLSAKAELITMIAAGTVKGSSRDSVHYSFIYDTDLSGSAVLNGEILHQDYFYSDTTEFQYFYTDFQGEFELPDYQDAQNEDFLISYWNLGSDQLRGNIQYQSALLAGKGSHYAQVVSDVHIEFWEVGTRLHGNERSSYSLNLFSELFSSLEIIYMSNSNEIPEPSVLFNLSCGLVMFCVAFTSANQRYRKKDKELEIR